MFSSIFKFLAEREKEFDQITADRKLTLEKLSAYLNQQINDTISPIQLTYICTHNSRRSHFGQIAAAVAAAYYQIANIKSYSGGTEVTAFNINAINALRSIGFLIQADEMTANPNYQVQFSNERTIQCFSKIFDHATNPQNKFAAILTCSSADEACPFIPGAEIRIATPYEDPKKGDGKENVNEIYLKSFKEITRETLYTFSKLK